MLITKSEKVCLTKEERERQNRTNADKLADWVEKEKETKEKKQDKK